VALNVRRITSALDPGRHDNINSGATYRGICAAAHIPRFTRFEAKHFLLEAARFMDGACRRCVIDNTSVMVAAGAGDDAVIAPEMHAFARTLGFDFRAHRINHPDRKGYAA
jgi:hypothetical protein